MSSHRGLRLVLVVAVLLVTVGLVADARAQAAITVNSSSSTVVLDYQISFHENVTTLSSANVVLDNSNSSQPQVVHLFQMAMQRIVKGVVINPSTFRFAAGVRQQSKNSTMWILSENFTLTVSGAQTTGQEISSYDLGFLDMNISDPLKLGGVELNNIGSAYLVSPITTAPSSTTFYLDLSLVRGGPYLNHVIPNLSTENFNILDFSWIPKISEWTHTYKPLDTSSTWTLSPGKDRPGLPYNLTMGFKTPEGTLLASQTAFYNLNLQLTAPARAVAEGLKISYPVSSSADFLMPTIVGATVVLATASFVAERRLVRPLAQSRKKRKG